MFDLHVYIQSYDITNRVQYIIHTGHIIIKKFIALFYFCVVSLRFVGGM